MRPGAGVIGAAEPRAQRLAPRTLRGQPPRHPEGQAPRRDPERAPAASAVRGSPAAAIRKSPSTSPGWRAASCNPTRQPNECPIQMRRSGGRRGEKFGDGVGVIRGAPGVRGAAASRRTPADRAAPSRPAAASPRPVAACCGACVPSHAPRRAAARPAANSPSGSNTATSAPRTRTVVFLTRSNRGVCAARRADYSVSIEFIASARVAELGLQHGGQQGNPCRGPARRALAGARRQRHHRIAGAAGDRPDAVRRVPGLCQSARPMVRRRGARRSPQLSARRAHAGRIDRGHAVARRTRQGAARAEAVGSVRTGLFGRGAPIEFDVALPAFHGLYGEDGQIQGLFETANLPYAGMRTLASSVFMDKVATKRLLRGSGIPLLPYAVVSRAAGGLPSAEALKKLLANIGFPCIVKPVHLGSSIGVGKADSIEDVRALLPTIFRLDPSGDHRTVRAEPRRIQCRGDADRRRAAHLGDRTAETRRGAARFPAEIPVGRRRQERHEGRRAEQPGHAVADPRHQPDSAPGARKQHRRWATDAFEAVFGTGAPRVDFYCNEATGEAWLNEVNPIPGSFALFPVGSGRPAARLHGAAVGADRRSHRAAPRNPAPGRPGAAGSAAAAPAVISAS